MSAQSEQENGCEMVTLPNGLRAIRERACGEVMHPGAGPLVEAESVYVTPSRLAERLEQMGSALVLFDVGLGAATNAITAWKVSEARATPIRRLEIVSFEHDLDALKLALQPENADELGLTRDGANAYAAASALLTHGRFETERTLWRTCLGDFRAVVDATPEASADIVYWDLYSPKTAPKLWTVSMFKALRRVCRDGATVHTYSASTSTRSGLLLGGFAVGIGNRTGARDETTVAATRVEDLAKPLGASFLERVSRSSVPFPNDVTPEERAEALSHVRACPQFAAFEVSKSAADVSIRD